MNDQSRIATRSGGRAARRAARAAALPDHLRPVRPGMEGGRYKPLSDADLTRIHMPRWTRWNKSGWPMRPTAVLR